MSNDSRDKDQSFASLFEQSAPPRRPQRRYQIGERLDVTIVAIARDAVFADLGGKQEGIFERSDLSDPEGKLHVDVGTTVYATVSAIDRATGQVKLTPAIIRNPDADIVATPATTGDAVPLLIEGAHVKGKVTGIERYGVFVQIAGTNGRSGRGLIPTAETATPRGSDLKKHFTVGQDLEAKILSIDPEGKIRLSVSALSADAERKDYETYKSGSSPQTADSEKKTRPAKPEPRGFGTLGDLLSKAAPKAQVAKEPAPAKKRSPAKRKG